MTSADRQFFDRFCASCPDLACAVYDADGGRVFGGEPCPTRYNLAEGTQYIHPNAFAVGLRLTNDCFLYFRGENYSAAEIEGTRRLALTIQRLLLQSRMLSTERERTRDKLSVLLRRLFALSTAEDIAYTSMSALNLDLDLTVPRVICLFRLNAADGGLVDKNMRRTALSVIENQSDITTQDLIGLTENSQIVLCKTVPPDMVNIRQFCQPLLAGICAALLDPFRIGVKVGVSNLCTSISDYSTGYLDIICVMRCLELIGSSATVSYVADHSLFLDILQIPPNRTEHFLGKKLALLEGTQQYAETVGALLQNNMNISATAEALFVHRNTVLFRINRMKRAMHIDPLHKSADRALLELLYLYSRFKPLIGRPTDDGATKNVTHGA